MDPVTGSAHTALAPYWAERLGRTSLTGLQVSPRSGLVGVELKGDRVIVTAGRDKGKSGEVLKVYPDDSRVLIAGVNVVKRHQRQTARVQGGIVSKEAPVHLSKIAHIDPKNGGPTRIGFKRLEDGRLVRFAKKSGEVIDV